MTSVTSVKLLILIYKKYLTLWRCLKSFKKSTEAIARSQGYTYCDFHFHYLDSCTNMREEHGVPGVRARLWAQLWKRGLPG